MTSVPRSGANGRVIPDLRGRVVSDFPRNAPLGQRCCLAYPRVTRAASSICLEGGGVAMRDLMRRTVVVAGVAVVLLGPAAGVARAAGGAAAGPRLAFAAQAIT